MHRLFFIKCTIFAPGCFFGALALNGCICPPCNCGIQAANGAGDGTTSGGDSGGGVAPSGDKHMLWDGEGAGDGAKGWADCDKKPNCKGTLAPAPGKGTDDSTALHFHGEGDGWIGGGWNFIGWWPEDGGIDVSGYGKLTFDIKVNSESEELAPDAGALNVALRCSKGKKDSEAVTIKNYAPDVLNGEWHKVEIPLGEFAKEEFDPTTMWEIDLSTWSQSPKKFDIYLDNIAVEK